jgi:hypothetical protein
MSWSEKVDRAFALRRLELRQELVEDGRRVVDELGAVVTAVATNHPLACVGAGVAAGVGMTMTRGVALSMLRLIRFGAGLLG